MTRTSLPPGFRFHPTDVELIKFYLKRKVMGKRISFEVISEIDIYKYCPWDLPEKSCLRSKDLEWYFFSPRERKYSNGARMNRATNYGFWKTTGKDRSIYYNDQSVGMIKTLIFHNGKAPRGNRTDWVMHEYRLEDKALADAGIAQDAYVICKIFQKSGPGPKNGAQYGAPFNEEEWSDDEVDCMGSFVLTELSAPPLTLQNNLNNSAATSTFIPGITICTGSSSETTLSHLVQCPDNMILPLPRDEISISDIPLPLHDDVMYSLEDCLTADTTVVPGSLEQSENLDNVNHGDLNGTASLDVNSLFEDLGELGKWGDLTQYSSGGSENSFAKNQMFGEDCIYLEDLECPLEGPSNINGLKCITADTGPPNYDFYYSSETPCFPSNYADPVQHGSSISNIRSSFVPDGPDGTYWYENDGQINNSYATFWNSPG